MPARVVNAEAQTAVRTPERKEWRTAATVTVTHGRNTTPNSMGKGPAANVRSPMARPVPRPTWNASLSVPSVPGVATASQTTAPKPSAVEGQDDRVVNRRDPDGARLPIADHEVNDGGDAQAAEDEGGRRRESP